MSNVIELKTRTTTVSESAIETLEHWLEMARSGKITQVAIAGLTSDNSSMTQWSELDHIQAMIGAITILNQRVINQVTFDD